MTDIDNLRALYEKATPEPWFEYDPGGEICHEFADVDRDGYPRRNFDRLTFNRAFPPAETNLIVALHNAFPALASELEAARKVVAAARTMSANEDHAMHRACYICDETWLSLVEYDRVMEEQR